VDLDVTVVTGTYGALSWEHLANTRAGASVPAGVPWIHEHGETLHDARNSALEQVQTAHVVFLDADDELEPGYLRAMAAGSADLRAPAVRYVTPRGRGRAPYVPRVAGHTHDCTAACLKHGNWIVIGAWAPTELVRSIGGFRDFAWSEDWDLWLRCALAGATIEPLPSAIYRAHVRADSRNRAPDRAARLAAHHAIYAANFSELCETT